MVKFSLPFGKKKAAVPAPSTVTPSADGSPPNPAIPGGAPAASASAATPVEPVLDLKLPTPKNQKGFCKRCARVLCMCRKTPEERERIRILREKAELLDAERKSRFRELDEMGSEEKLTWDALELPERNCKRLVGLATAARRQAGEDARSKALADAEAKEEGATYHHCVLKEFKRYKASAALHTSYEAHKNHVHAFKVSPDYRYIVSASADHTIKMWEASTAKVLRTFEGHSKAVRGVDLIPGFNFADEARLIVSCSSDKTLRIWDARTDQAKLVLKGHTDVVYDCSFSPDGKSIVSCSEDRTLRLWSTNEGHLIYIYNGHKSAVLSVTFSPGGRFILSGSDYGEREIKLWHAVMPVIRKPETLGSRVFFSKAGLIKRISFSRILEGTSWDEFFREPDSDDEENDKERLAADDDDADDSDDSDDGDGDGDDNNADTDGGETTDAEGTTDDEAAAAAKKKKNNKKKKKKKRRKKNGEPDSDEEVKVEVEDPTSAPDVKEKDGFSVSVLMEGRFDKLREAGAYYAGQELVVMIRGVKPFQSFFVACYLKGTQFDMFDPKSGGRTGSFDRASVMENESAWLSCGGTAATSDSRKKGKEFNNVKLRWTAPPEQGVGDVTFKVTLVPKNLDDPGLKRTYALSFSLEETSPPKKKEGGAFSSSSASSSSYAFKPKVKLGFDVAFNHSHMISLFRDEEFELVENFFSKNARCYVPPNKPGGPVLKARGPKAIIELLAGKVLGPNQIMMNINPMQPTQKIIESRSLVVRDALPPAKVDPKLLRWAIQEEQGIRHNPDDDKDHGVVVVVEGEEPSEPLDAAARIALNEPDVNIENLRREFKKIARLEVALIIKMKKAQLACAEEVRTIHLPEKMVETVSFFQPETDELINNGYFGAGSEHLLMPLPFNYPVAAKPYDLAAQAAKKGKALIEAALNAKSSGVTGDVGEALSTESGRRLYVNEIAEYMLELRANATKGPMLARRNALPTLPGYEDLAQMRADALNPHLVQKVGHWVKGDVPLDKARSNNVRATVNAGKHGEEGAQLLEQMKKEAKRARIVFNDETSFFDGSQLKFNDNAARFKKAEPVVVKEEPKRSGIRHTMAMMLGFGGKEKTSAAADKSTTAAAAATKTFSAATSSSPARTSVIVGERTAAAENLADAAAEQLAKLITGGGGKDKEDESPRHTKSNRTSFATGTGKEAAPPTTNSTATTPIAKKSTAPAAADHDHAHAHAHDTHMPTVAAENLRKYDGATLPGFEIREHRSKGQKLVNIDIDLLVAEQNHGLVRTFLEGSGKHYNGHAASINEVAFSHDERRIASCSSDRTIKIWDPIDGNMVMTMYGHSDEVMGVSFSHDGMFVASCGLDNLVIVWNLTNGGVLKRLFGHYDAVYRCCFTHNSNALMSAGCDMTIKSWNLTPNVPDPPQKPVISEITTSKCLVTWSPPPGYNEEITAYCVDYRIGHRGEFGDAVTVSGKDKRKKITTLISGTAYQFRVRAVNRMGLGAWSEPSAQIITEFGLPQRLSRPEVHDVKHHDILITFFARVPTVKGSAIQEFEIQLSGYGVEFGKGSVWRDSWTNCKDTLKKWEELEEKRAEYARQGKDMEEEEKKKKAAANPLKGNVKKMMMGLRMQRESKAEVKSLQTSKSKSSSMFPKGLLTDVKKEVLAEGDAEAAAAAAVAAVAPEGAALGGGAPSTTVAVSNKLKKKNFQELQLERKKAFIEKELMRTRQHLEDQRLRRIKREQVKNTKKASGVKQARLERKYQKSKALKELQDAEANKHASQFVKMAFRAPGLSPGIMYRLRVAAINTTGVGPHSDPCFSIFTLSAAPDAPPAVFLKKPELRALEIGWETPHDNGSAITAFRMRQCWDGLEHEYKRTVQAVRLPDLEPGRSYTFQVKSENSEGWSPWSKESAPLWTLMERPFVPEKPQFVAKSPASVTIKIKKPFDNGDPILHYVVRKREMSVKRKTPWGIGGTFQAEEVESIEEEPEEHHPGKTKQVTYGYVTITGLFPNSHYDFMAACTNKSGQSDFSPSSYRIKTLPAQVPSVVSRVWLSVAGPTSCQLNWDMPEDNGLQIEGFVVEEYMRATKAVKPEEEHREVYNTGPLNRRKIDGMDPGSSYRFRVLATNAVGKGEFSDYTERLESTSEDRSRMTSSARPEPKATVFKSISKRGSFAVAGANEDGDSDDSGAGG